MFPGYAVIYKDESGKVHLYFFPGISSDGTPIYRDIDLGSIKTDFTSEKLPDGAVDIEFKYGIMSVTCNLIKYDTGGRVIKHLAI